MALNYDYIIPSDDGLRLLRIPDQHVFVDKSARNLLSSIVWVQNDSYSLTVSDGQVWLYTGVSGSGVTTDSDWTNTTELVVEAQATCGDRKTNEDDDYLWTGCHTFECNITMNATPVLDNHVITIGYFNNNRLRADRASLITAGWNFSGGLTRSYIPTVDQLDHVATMGDLLNINGVSSFNGRQGLVVPEIGDYTTEMITETSLKRFVSNTQISYWNSKSNFDGSYNSLSDKPDTLLRDVNETILNPWLFNGGIVLPNNGKLSIKSSTGSVRTTITATSSDELAIGDNIFKTLFYGSATRPLYNGKELALLTDATGLNGAGSYSWTGNWTFNNPGKLKYNQDVDETDLTEVANVKFVNDALFAYSNESNLVFGSTMSANTYINTYGVLKGTKIYITDLSSNYRGEWLVTIVMAPNLNWVFEVAVANGVLIALGFSDVTSVFGRKGQVVPLYADYDTDLIKYDDNLSLTQKLEEIENNNNHWNQEILDATTASYTVELNTKLVELINTDDQTASEVPIEAIGDLGASEVQTALQEIYDRLGEGGASLPPELDNVIRGVKNGVWSNAQEFQTDLDDSIQMNDPVGSIPAGTTVADLKTMGLSLIIEKILFTVLYAAITRNNSEVLTVNGVSSIVEIGSSPVISLVSSFTSGEITNGDSSKVRLVGDVTQHEFTGLGVTDGVITSNNDQEVLPSISPIIQQGTNSWTSVVTFTTGTAPYYDSYGNEQNDDMINNQRIGGTMSNTKTISGQYLVLWLASDDSISSGTEIKLHAGSEQYWESETNKTLVGGAKDGVKTFRLAVPDTKTLTSVEIWNGFLWEVNSPSSMNPIATTSTDGGGNLVNYTMYTLTIGKAYTEARNVRIKL